MKNKSIYALSVTLLFCGFLLIFFVLSAVAPPSAFSETENRYLEQRPHLNWKTLKSGEFGRKYELYLSDQFPLRNRWIGLKTAAEMAQYKKEINGVFLGKDGYLIEALYKEDIDQELYEKNLDRLRLFADVQSQALGMDHVRIMLAPSSSQILTDQLPASASPFDQRQVLEDFIASGGAGELLVPVSSALTASLMEHPGQQLYYRTDHHWTTYGAYAGYESWARSSGLTPYGLTDFHIETVSDSFYGTIQSKLNAAAKSDSIQLFHPIDPPDWDVYYDGSQERHDSLYATEALDTKDQYRVFLDGNHGWTKIVNRDLEDGKRLLILKDSYAHCFAPFAALHFGQAHMLDLRYYNGKISDFIKEQEITDILVLYQIPGFVRDVNISKLNR